MITKVANQGREVRIDALQADFGKYRRERSENSGKKSPVKPVMCYCLRRHLHEDPRE